MSTAHDLAEVEAVVRTVAGTCVEHEDEFSALDAVAGDGDFGHSLARGFGAVLERWDTFDRSDAGGFLVGVAATLTSRTGGTSGPIWGTAFLRAGGALRGRSPLGPEDAVVALRSAVEGIKARGGADLGDKTLLDALIPATEAVAARVDQGPASAQDLLDVFAATATEAAAATAGMTARRGRASYTGERSRGSVDAGATALAVIAGTVAARRRQPA